MDGRVKAGGPLSSCRVLDVTDEKGMFCARLLADMGAEVIRVEKPWGDTGGDTFIRAANIGKLGITLDLESERGQGLFRQLIETADILVESYQPGYLETLNLGYSRLSQINKRLIMASIANFGQSGPYRDYRSCDLVASALGGQMYVCGEPEMPPLKLFGNQAYYSTGLFAAVGILLALWHRHTTGRGQHIDISLQECVVSTLDHVLVRYFYEGVVAERRGSLHWNNAFRVFPCRDGYVLLSLFQQWETLVEWLDVEGMAGDLTDNRWRDREERLRHLDHVVEVLERWTKSHSVADLVEKGQLMRFPWAEVVSIPQLLNSHQLNERGFFVEVENPHPGKKCKLPGAPGKMSRSPWWVGSHTPMPGEHNNAIYQGELGLSEEEIGSLAADGII